MGFFGGRPGKDFQIKKVFSNTVELQADLDSNKISTVDIGDIILIFYGLQNDSKYSENRDKDKENYNSTFWQKIYIRNTEEKDESDIIIFSTDNAASLI